MGSRIIKLKQGLNLPIGGAPKPTIEDAPKISRVAFLGPDHHGLKPRLKVAQGDKVKRGTPLVEDRGRPGAVHTSPAAGEVLAINRGAQRRLLSIEIKLSEAEQNGQLEDNEQVQLDTKCTDRDSVIKLLVDSGLWTALRTRPFSRTPQPDDNAPGALFINAADSNPLAPPVEKVIEGRQDDLKAGLEALAHLPQKKTYLCTLLSDDLSQGVKNVEQVQFAGAHPAGNVGVHIHHLAPATRPNPVWYLGIQDVLSIGKLIRTGKLDFGRVIALSGPGVKEPRLLRTRVGANLDELLKQQLSNDAQRVISGSILNGRKVDEPLHYIGRFHQQVTALPEDDARKFLGWLTPGLNKHSVIRTFLSGFLPRRPLSFSTTTNGSPRAIVPIGNYEKVMPMDLIPTYLLRALAMGDLEQAEELGCLELDEEDLALCTYVCAGKTDYGPMLRNVLTHIEKEG